MPDLGQLHKFRKKVVDCHFRLHRCEKHGDGIPFQHTTRSFLQSYSCLRNCFWISALLLRGTICIASICVCIMQLITFLFSLRAWHYRIASNPALMGNIRHINALILYGMGTGQHTKTLGRGRRQQSRKLFCPGSSGAISPCLRSWRGIHRGFCSLRGIAFWILSAPRDRFLPSSVDGRVSDSSGRHECSGDEI